MSPASSGPASSGTASHAGSVRLSAWLLAAAGVLPFLGAVLDRVLLDGTWVPSVQIYAAVIASFVCGIHWGAALFAPEPLAIRLLVLSNVLALGAWLAALLPVSAGFLLLAPIFAALLLVDGKLRRAGLWPEWFWKLRVAITIVVVCASGLIGVMGGVLA